MTRTAPEWARGMRALATLAIAPATLKGMTVRARPGPARQAFENALSVLPLPLRRIHPGLSDTQLFGSLDIAASLANGRMIRGTGIADKQAALVMPMAERLQPQLAARLSQLLDTGAEHALVMLDEGADADECAPLTLRERLPFSVDLSEVKASEAIARLPAPADLDAARDRVATVTTDPDHERQLVLLADRLGIESLRAPLLALYTARALAALDGEDCTTDTHIREAVTLVYPSRATQFPQQDTPEDTAEDRQTEPEAPDDAAETEDQGQTDLPEEMLIEAVRACLPDDLLARFARDDANRNDGHGSGAGSRRTGNRRGRPLSPRPGRPDGRSRIDVVATLRAAAPWQPLRRKARPKGPTLIIHPSDIRLQRFEDRSDRLVIFAVDASGSAAMARMAEAKGAVELLLAQAYAKRDQVALIAFRGQTSDVLLSPTRSLVQAKRQLAGLPGGGGTPLASGLQNAFELAHHGRRRGFSPSVAFLTDGRANIALDGTPGREPARRDARIVARHLRLLGLPAVVIDTAARPGDEGIALADWLAADYLALPRADAGRICAATDKALNG